MPAIPGDKSQVVADTSKSCPTQVNYSSLSVSEIINAVLERNKDPIIEKMMFALISKLPQELAERIEEEKKERSIVIEWLPEPASDLSPSAKQRDLEEKVSEIFDVLNLECRPLELYRMGRQERGRVRKVKVVLPSKSHWATALSNSWRLRGSAAFTKVRVRRSMTQEERKREFELRQECRERNKQLNGRVWVVYRGELRRIEDLPKKPRDSGNV